MHFLIILLGVMSLLGAGKAGGGGGGGGPSLSFGIDATNYAGGWNTTTMPLACPSANCPVTGSSSTQFGIGAASANRVVIALFGYNGAGASPNATITGVMFNGTVSGASCTGGTAATQAIDGNFAGPNNGNSGIWYAAVSSGTTAAICFTAVGGNGWGGQGVVTVVTLTDSLGAGHIAVSSTNGAFPPGYNVTNCASNICTNSWTGTTVPSGGIGLTASINQGSPGTATWSGTASPTGSVNPNNSGVGGSISSALGYWTTSGTVTQAEATTGFAGFAGAVFQP